MVYKERFPAKQILEPQTRNQQDAMKEPTLDPPPERDLDREAEVRAAAADHWDDCAVDREEADADMNRIEHDDRGDN
jgi:hypothetical protein